MAGSTSHPISEEPIVALAGISVVEAIRRAGNAASGHSVQSDLADALDCVPAFVGGADLTDAIDQVLSSDLALALKEGGIPLGVGGADGSGDTNFGFIFVEVGVADTDSLGIRGGVTGTT